MQWIVLTNSNQCRIFSFCKADKKLNLIKEINHPENREKDFDLVSDSAGRYKSDAGGHGAYSQQTDPKEIKIDQFMLELCNALDEARTHDQFNQLVIIAPPKTHGLLTQRMNKNVEKLISQVIQKDLVFLKEHELLDLLIKEIK